MPTEDFVHRIEIDVTPDRLIEFLSDLHNYVPLHPLMESIEDIAPTAELPAARHYRVVDRVPIGPFRVRTVYTAALEPMSEFEMRGCAWQFPAVRVDTRYVLEATASGTHLTERVTIQAPSLLRRFVISQARKAHLETLEQLKVLLEGEPDDRTPPAI